MGKMEQEKLTPIIVCLQPKQEPIINYLFIRFNFEKHFNKASPRFPTKAEPL